MVTAQAVLIIAGVAFVAVAITGIRQVRIFEIPKLNGWSRGALGMMGGGLFACAFLIPTVTDQPSGQTPIASNPTVPPVGAGTPSNSPVPVMSQPSPPPRTPAVTIDAPKSSAEVSENGFQARGTVSVSSLGTDALWLFDQNGSSYYIDEQVTVPSSGKWYATEGSIKGDAGSALTIAIVLANQSCNSRLSSAKNSYLGSLPPGCKRVAEITVNVTKS
jgi:hypothetical protein